MKSSLTDLPIKVENLQRVSRGTEWGGMVIFAGEIHQDLDHTPSLTGSPDERCQCPHWGYVLKGQIRFDIAGQEEEFNEGDLFYVPPEHLVLSETAGSQYIILMPADEWKKEEAKRTRQDLGE